MNALPPKPKVTVEAEPFIPYTAVTRSGTEVTGIIVSETPNSLTLRFPNGSEETLLRAELESLASLYAAASGRTRPQNSSVITLDTGEN